MKTLVVGYGNPLRSDDGIGPYVVRRLSSRKLADVTFRICYQLGIELVDDVRDCERVIFVDAGESDERFRFRQLHGDSPSASSTHQLSPETLCRLARNLNRSVARFFLCTVGASDFSFGERFSHKAVAGADAAVEFLTGRLKKGARHARSELHGRHRSSHSRRT